jgi:hypothetical protein
MCELRLDARVLSLDEIAAHTTGAHRPLVITGLTAHLDGEASAAAFVEAQTFIKSAARGASVSSCDSPILALLGGNGPRRALAEYLQHVVLDGTAFDDEPMVFDDGGFLSSADGQELATRLHTERADAALGSGGGKLVFEMATGTVGLTWHTNPRSWMELLVGKKRWFTATLGNASVHFDETLPTAAWVESALGGDPFRQPSEGVCAFTQHPGEVVFIPDSLMSATYSFGYSVSYGRQDQRPQPNSYLQLLNAASRGPDVDEGSSTWARDSIDALRDGLARYPLDFRFLALDSHRLAAEAAAQLAAQHDADATDAALMAALQQVDRSLAANTLNLGAQFHRTELLSRLGFHDKALCAVWRARNYLHPATRPLDRRWGEPHPSFSRRAALEYADKMLDELAHKVPKMGGLGSGGQIDCGAVDALANAVETNASFNFGIGQWSRYTVFDWSAESLTLPQ